MTAALRRVLGDRTTVREVRATLAALGRDLGDAGLAVAEVLPGLRAALDQHAAAVRDSLGGDTAALTAGALAGYAAGLCEAAGTRGWRMPAEPVDWSAADWVATRLLAVCALAAPLSARA
ncbi:hypothetical protein GCM10010124_17860 [Pilimelia terevasa]|uniref:Uncharacterized protein n=1 Tax=Pilimelia terevasa TaxID=53372 RepID=A0A8J3FGP2_9ACTN|nr:DUF6401 family natural product biosynthesis protein [Pilimelia terevasa]GGK25717.1 hypothetical protein GCM10010124_17860 [Pilimelia terevasa]